MNSSRCNQAWSSIKIEVTNMKTQNLSSSGRIKSKLRKTNTKKQRKTKENLVKSLNPRHFTINSTEY